ncbi:hypothetical protein ACA910_018267 [Epithemia clementina (nom. ined.)]
MMRTPLLSIDQMASIARRTRWWKAAILVLFIVACVNVELAFNVRGSSADYAALLARSPQPYVPTQERIVEISPVHNHTVHVINSTFTTIYDKHLCLKDGLQGTLKPNAVATVVAPLKRISLDDLQSDDFARTLHVLLSWRQVPRVNFVVMSTHCSVLQMAAQLGLPTLQLSSGSDVGDLTYRHILESAVKVSSTPIVGFVNGDIAFDESLVHTLDAVLREREWNPELWKHFMLVGQRTNVDVPDELLQSHGLDNATLPPQWDDLMTHVRSHGELFRINAEDYFLFNRDIAIPWSTLPPFLIGGVYFDNWFTDYVRKQPNMELIDASKTLRAYHFNHHGTNRFRSHEGLASELNRLAGKKFPITRKYYGLITEGDWQTRPTNDSNHVTIVLKPGVNRTIVHPTPKALPTNTTTVLTPSATVDSNSTNSATPST